MGSSRWFTQCRANCGPDNTYSSISAYNTACNYVLETTNVYKIFDGRPHGMRPLGT
jgi:hypothetical protein